MKIKMRKGAPEAELGQQKSYLPSSLLRGGTIWKFPLTCSVVLTGFYAIREAFSGSYLYLWMMSWLHVLPGQWLHMAETPTQPPVEPIELSSWCGNEAKVVYFVCCSDGYVALVSTHDIWVRTEK